MEFSNSDEFAELRRVLTRKKIMLQQKELFIFNTIYFSFSVMYTFVEYVYIIFILRSLLQLYLLQYIHIQPNQENK